MPGYPKSLREIRESGKGKIAIVGFCTTSRDLAPYGDPDFCIAGLNRGYLFMPRADVWFDMHSPQIIASQQRRPGRHVEWLNGFPGPVYVHARHAALGDNQVVYPLAEIAADLGPWVWRIGQSATPCDRQPCAAIDHRGPTSGPGGPLGGCTCACHQATALRDTTGEPYLSSSIAYEIALAIFEGFKEIHLYGVDLNTGGAGSGEYAWQKPGVEFLLGVAAGRGIKVVLPENCPLLKGTLYGRGFLSPAGEAFDYDQLSGRLSDLQKDYQAVQQEAARLTGAKRELEYLAQQLIPGADPERLEAEIAGLQQKLAQVGAKAAQLDASRSETERYLRVRVAALQAQTVQDQAELGSAAGALQALGTVQHRMLPGVDHERTEDRRKQMEQHLAALQQGLLQTQGAIQETAYWLHQTMAGQDPGEAIRLLLDRGADGPLTDREVLQSVDPAIAGDSAGISLLDQVQSGGTETVALTPAVGAD